MKKFILLLTILSTSAFAALSDLDKADVTSTNILKNPGFESGLADWTKTGGTWSLQSSGSKLGFGKGSLCWDSSAAGQKLKSTVATIPNALKGKNGEMKISIQTPTGTSTHILRITDGTNPVASPANVITSTAFQAHSLNLVVPSSGGVGVEIESVNANEPEICLDLGYIGEATNLSSQVLNTEWVAYTPTFSGMGTVTNISFFSRRNGSNLEIMGKWTTGTAAASEARISLGFNGVDGNVTSQTTVIPSIRNVGTWAAGSTVSTFVKAVLMESGLSYLTFGFNATSTAELTKQNGSSAFMNSADHSLTASIPISGWTSQLAVNSLNADYGPTAYTPTISAGFGAATSISFFHERKGKMLHVWGSFITGSCAASLGTISLPSGLALDSAYLSLANNDTSAGPKVGTLTTRGANQHTPIVTATGTSTSLVYMGNNFTNTDSLIPTNPSVNLSNSIFTVVDFEVPIDGWSENQNAPILVGSVTSSAAGAEVVVKGKFYTTSFGTACSASPCDKSADPAVSSVTRTGTGDYTINFVSGTFSATPICNILPYVSGSVNMPHDEFQSTNTSTAYRFTVRNSAATVSNASVAFTCLGSK